MSSSTTSGEPTADPTVESQPPLATGLSLRGITKRFGALVANNQINLDIVPGRIHCLLGENGAGKSTLMNILYGLLDADEGAIYIDGQEQRFTNPRQSMAAGIGMVHQHFMLVEPFTVAENIILGREQATAGVLSMREARAKVTQLSQQYKLQVSPDAVVEHLPVGVQQRVEILKSLANDARFLIFDEPTAVLTPQEITELMAVMTSLRDEGRAIVFITHKLREVRAIADDITVIRRGTVVGQAEPSASEGDLAELMVGRSVSLTVDKEPAAQSEDRLVVENLTVADAAGQVVVNDVSMTIAGGEIVCIAGVQGNGQTELAEVILGLTPVLRGRVSLDGTDLTKLGTKQTIKAGVGFVPEDRQHDGFVGSFSVAENLVLNQVESYSRRGVLNIKAMRANAEAKVDEFDIRTQSIDTSVSSLSGGNAQKVVLARELSRPLSLLVASQPTRGVDVGAIEFLHKRIVAERDAGTAVMIVSTELDEIESLADRIAVMNRGQIVGIVPAGTPRDVLGLMMAGIPHHEAVIAAEADAKTHALVTPDDDSETEPSDTSPSSDESEGGDR